MAKALITVFGATGKQGGSVARALLEDGGFAVRAVTRNTQSASAVKLKEQGAELCVADLDKKETLGAAVKDAQGAFVVTNFWAHMDKERDTKQGLDIVDVCKEAGVKHIVMSSLESCKDLSGIAVAHFDSKAIVEEHIKKSGVPFTNVRAAAYHENFLDSFLNRAQGSTFGVGVPMEGKPLHLMHIDGIGGCVRSILKEPAKYNGQTIGLASDTLTNDEVVEVFNKVFQPEKNFINFNMTATAFAGLGFPGAEELADMFRFYQTGKCERDVELTRKLNPAILNFHDWVAQNKDAIAANLDKQPEK